MDRPRQNSNQHFLSGFLISADGQVQLLTPETALVHSSACFGPVKKKPTRDTPVACFFLSAFVAAGCQYIGIFCRPEWVIALSKHFKDAIGRYSVCLPLRCVTWAYKMLTKLIMRVFLS